MNRTTVGSMHMALVALLLGMAAWALDAFVDAYLFHAGSFADLLLFNIPPHELYMRVFVVCLLLLSAAYLIQLRKNRASLAAMELSERHFQIAFEKSPDAVNINRLRDGLYVNINQGFTDLTGFTWQDVEGKTSLDINIWNDPADRARLVELLKTKGEADNLEAVFRLKDGSTTTALMSAKILVIRGEPHILSVTRDISQRKNAEKMLRESENRFRNTLEGIDLFAVQLDVDGRLLFCNDCLLKATGWGAEEVLGRDWFETFLPKEQRGEIVKIFSEAVRSGNLPTRYENTILTRAGEKRLVRWNNLVLRDAAGGIIGTTSLGEDITDHARAKAQLMRLAAAVEQTADEIVLTDAHGTIQFVNRAFQNSLGYASEEVLGQPVTLFDASLKDPEETDRRLAILHSEKSWQGRTWNRAKDGRELLHEVSVSPVLGPDKELLGFVSAMRDITRQVATEKQLAQAQKMEAIGTLAGGIAHDFNNILTAIEGFTELALMKCADDDLQEDLNQVHNAALRATRLVKQILDFSRISKEQAKPLQPKLIVKEALKLLRASLPSTIEIRRNIRTESQVLADPGELHRVVVNLCTNAALAMSDAGGVLEVTLDDVVLDADLASLHTDLAPGTFVRLAVKDNGCGMTEEVRTRIFEPFFTTRMDGKGTGMGLSVVHGIIRNRGGAILVDSEPGLGTTFEVYLPTTQAPALIVEKTADSPTTGTERILFVDDEPQVTTLAKRSLGRLGYRVTACTSSLEALARFQAGMADFDVVITDTTMPHMTGDQLALAIKALRPETPVILCTGYSEKVSSDKAREMGIDEFALKPVTGLELSRIIRRILKPAPSTRHASDEILEIRSDLP